MPRESASDIDVENASDIDAAYGLYVAGVSDPVWAISLELSRFLLKLMTSIKPATILDLGSGFSSYVLRKGDAKVYSIDTDAGWLNKTREFLSRFGLENGYFGLLEDFKFGYRYDLILCDIGWAQDRKKLFPLLNDLSFNTIVFDDANDLSIQENVVRCFPGRTIVSLERETRDKFGRYSWMVLGSSPSME